MDPQKIDFSGEDHLRSKKATTSQTNLRIQPIKHVQMTQVKEHKKITLPKSLFVPYLLKYTHHFRKYPYLSYLPSKNWCKIAKSHNSWKIYQKNSSTYHPRGFIPSLLLPAFRMVETMRSQASMTFPEPMVNLMGSPLQEVSSNTPPAEAV